MPRVTFVNFAVTTNSLQVYCLDQLLKFEQPDTFARQRDLKRMQGACQAKLMLLERQLLDVLNKSEGKILEDNVVLATLENLKLEALAEEQKVCEIQDVMAAVQLVSQKYHLVAQSCCRIFFALQRLANLHYLYQFSFNSFLNIFASVLQKTEYGAERDFPFVYFNF
jgi:dynein heavy chain 1